MANLESKSQSGKECYVLHTHTWDMASYWILSKNQIETKSSSINDPSLTGPFTSMAAAREWCLRDLENREPKAYERFKKKHADGKLFVSGRYLTCDRSPEFIMEMLNQDAYLIASEDDKKMRLAFLKNRAEMLTLYNELTA